MLSRVILSVMTVTLARTEDRRVTVNGNSLRFLVLGDFGGFPLWPYHTSGQVTVAEGMGQLAEQKQTHFQMALGDNFYLTGVPNVDSSRFYKTFESIYSSKGLQTPWYLLAGNHDHYGNVTAEIMYTKKSRRWHFPSLYYLVKYKLDDGTTVDIVMIDTVTLCGNTRELKNTGFFEYFIAQEHNPTGPDDLRAANGQWAWIEQQLKSSTANYLFVAGHFPVYSIAEHGPTDCLVERLQPLLSTYKVSAYLSGHDHNLQHLKYTENGWTTHYVVSGMGAYSDRSKFHKRDVPAGSLQFHFPERSSITTHLYTHGGYVYGEVSSSSAEFTFLDGENHALNTFSISPRNVNSE